MPNQFPSLKIKNYFLIPLISGLIFLPALIVQAAQGDIYGLNTTAGAAGYKTGPSAPTIDIIIGDIIFYVLSFVGVIFLILTIYAGFTWMTAGGNEEKIKKAKKLLTNSIIGLIIALGAAAITNYILLQLSSA